MIAFRSNDNLISLLKKLIGLDRETEWLEFKQNYENPESIGEYISALSNSAALSGKEKAYIIWGIDDTTHAIIGTTFDPSKTKVGNEELENWLLRFIHPKIYVEFYIIDIEDKRIVLLEIQKSVRQPVRFKRKNANYGGFLTKFHSRCK